MSGKLKFWLITMSMLLLASCDSSAISTYTGSKASMTASIKPSAAIEIATPLPSIAATPTPFTEPLMTDNLVELYVGQQSKEGYGSVSAAPYNNDHTGLHTQPLHLAIHDEIVYLFFSLKKGPQEVIDALLKQIKVSPGVKYEITPAETGITNELRFKMDINDYGQSMTMQFGNTPEIFLFRTEPMKISLDNTNSEAATLLFPSTGTPMGIYLLTPDNQTVTFVFSEPIDPTVTNVEPNPGEWIDDTHYRIKLTANSFTELPLLMFNVTSIRGNTLKFSDRSLTLRFIKEKAWFDNNTEKEILGGPRLHFYDNFIYSPNKRSYVANVFLEGPFGDEAGGHYGLVVERRNEMAVILETDYYIAGLSPELQVYWLDDHQFIYKSGERILLYDVTSNQKTDLIRMPDPQKGYINTFTYDPFLKKLHVIWIKYDDSGDSSLNILTHSLYDIKEDNAVLIKEEAYPSESTFEYKYLPLALAMHPNKKGFYWTKVNKGRISTEYISNKGTKAHADGKIIGVNELGVFLLTEPPYGAEGNGDYKERKLYYWKQGAAKPKQLLIPDNLGEIKAFGQSLSATSNELANFNFRYEMATNKWLPLNNEETLTTVPYQEAMAIYRQE